MALTPPSDLFFFPFSLFVCSYCLPFLCMMLYIGDNVESKCGGGKFLCDCVLHVVLFLFMFVLFVLVDSYCYKKKKKIWCLHSC